jgi:hypothetical protein
MSPTLERSASTFRQHVGVCCLIRARPGRVWSLLTDARRFPEWNSTITSLEGSIAVGEKLALKVRLDPKRTFSPRVTRLDPERAMEWSDGFAPMFKGVRTFTLAEKDGGVTEFAMREVFTGAMLPLIRGSLPDFGPSFEAFARDLKRAAEEGV